MNMASLSRTGVMGLKQTLSPTQTGSLNRDHLRDIVTHFILFGVDIFRYAGLVPFRSLFSTISRPYPFECHPFLGLW